MKILNTLPVLRFQAVLAGCLRHCRSSRTEDCDLQNLYLGLQVSIPKTFKLCPLQGHRLIWQGNLARQTRNGSLEIYRGLGTSIDTLHVVQIVTLVTIGRTGLSFPFVRGSYHHNLEYTCVSGCPTWTNECTNPTTMRGSWICCSGMASKHVFKFGRQYSLPCLYNIGRVQSHTISEDQTNISYTSQFPHISLCPPNLYHN